MDKVLCKCGMHIHNNYMYKHVVGKIHNKRMEKIEVVSII